MTSSTNDGGNRQGRLRHEHFAFRSLLEGPPYRYLLAAEARLAVLVLSGPIVSELREKLTDKFALPAVEVDAII